MAVTVKIEAVDRTSLIDWRTFSFTSILTNQVDTVRFRIRKHAGQTYKPDLNDDIEVLDGATKIFAGKIIDVKEEIEGKLMFVDVLAKDHTHEMDNNLVIRTFENTTVDAIIEDIKTDFLPAGFTTTNVSVTTAVSFIAFNYEQPSKVLQQLAELVGADWFVDVDKDINFFLKKARTASFNLTDTNQKYFFNTLKIRDAIENLRNVIFVRGGTFRGASAFEELEADGDALIYKQGQRYSDIAVEVDSVGKTVGIDNIDSPAGFDVLYNFQEKFIRFKSGTKPSATAIIKVTGLPHLPVIVKIKDNVSIDSFGERQFKIIDKSLNSKEGARERAKAELADWADDINEAEFETKESGLLVGEEINIQSDIRDLDQNYIINRIETRFRTPESFQYRVVLITRRTMGMVEFLQNLLIRKDKEIEINPDEILDVIEAANENISIGETVVKQFAIDLPESVTIGEALVSTLFSGTYKWANGVLLPDKLRWDLGQWE